MSIGDALGYFVYAMLAVLIVWLFFIFRQRIAAQAQAQRLADAAFEAQVLRAATAAEQSHAPLSAFGDNPGPMASALSDAMPIPAAEAVAGGRGITVAANEEVFRRPADAACAAVINQLRHSGMVEDVDGYLDLNGNSKGAVILRMKGGKHALVLPYFETEPFALRNLRRYDMIIQVGRNGKAVVMRSLEEVIASQVAGTMR